MGFIDSTTDKSESQYLNCNIECLNSSTYDRIRYNGEIPNKVFIGKPDGTGQNAPTLVFCKRYTYTRGNLPTGVKSITCHRKSTLLPKTDTSLHGIPIGTVPVKGRRVRKYSGIILNIYWQYWDYGVFYGDEVWFSATYDEDFTPPNPEFTIDGTSTGVAITENNPLTITSDISATSFFNSPELKSYSLKAVGHDENASFDYEEDKWDTSVSFDDGTSISDLTDLIKIERISTKSGDGTGFIRPGDTIYSGDTLKISVDCSEYVNNLCIKTYPDELPSKYSSGVTPKYLVQNGQPGGDGYWNGWTETTNYDESTRMINSITYDTITVNSDIDIEVIFEQKHWNEWDLINDPNARTFGQEPSNPSDTSTMEIRDEGNVLWWGIGEDRFTSSGATSANWKHDLAILKNLRYFPSNQIDVQEWCGFGETNHTWNGDHCTVPEDRNWAWSGLITTQHDENNKNYLGVEGSASLFFYNETVNNKTQRARGLKVTWRQGGGQYYWAYRIGGIKIRCSNSYSATTWIEPK